MNGRSIGPRSNSILRAVLVAAGVLAAVIGASPVGADDSDKGFEISTDHIYGHKAGMALTFDVVRPTTDSNGLGLLYMVSRGWQSNYFDLDSAMETSKSRNGRFYRLIDRGYTLFMVRHGSTPYFKVPDAASDVRLAVRFIRNHADDFAVDGDRLGVFGNSAGGHLALMLGTTGDTGDAESDDPVLQTSSKVAAVVAYYPPVDLRTRGEVPDEGPLAFDPGLQASVSPLTHVSSDDPPTLLIHGDKDPVVPLKNSQDILEAFRDAGVESELIVMPGAGHAFPGLYGSRASAALADWFDDHLSGS